MPVSTSSMGRVISLDPGGTTGYTLAYKDGPHLYVAPCQAELDHHGIYNLLTDNMPKHVICEDFEYRPGIARPYIVLVSLEYIGVVKLWCAVGARPTPLFMQKAAQAIGDNNFFNDLRLKRMGLYKRGVPHGLDSMRHFLYWFFFKYGSQFNTPKLGMEQDPYIHLVEESWIKPLYFAP